MASTLDVMGSLLANHNAAVSHSYVLKQESAQLYPKGAGVDFGGGDAIDHIPYDGLVTILTLQ